MKLKNLLCIAIALCALMTGPSFAIVGVGVHYGIDVSMSMEDKVGEQAALSDLKLDVTSFGGTIPTGFTKQFLSGAELPVTINRTGFARHAFNLGGKVYIDIIPFIDCIELSANYGMWQYEGMIKYPTGITFNTSNATNTQDIRDIATIAYDSTMITLEKLGLDNPFLKKTPYAKLNFDLTVRKYIVQFPPVSHSLKVYGGAGATLNFATPVLSAGLVQKAIGSSLGATNDVGLLKPYIFDPSNPAMKKLGEEFFKQLFTPHWGAHLDLGVMFKIPLAPIGFYIDGKYMFPFGDMDDNVKSLKLNGLLFNAGIAFAL